MQLLHLTNLGPTAPNTPRIEMSISYAMEAMLNWTVGSIAYTPENYHIEFGVSSDVLNMRSDVINGSSNLTSTNLLYSTTLTGLSPFTQYYYRIVATNSFITTRTVVEMFRTSETGIANCKKLMTKVKMLESHTFSFL